MPADLERCVAKVAVTKGKDAAYAICTDAMKGKKKRKRKKAASKSGMHLSEDVARHVLELVGANAPHALLSHADSILRPCLSGGSDPARCHEQAILGIRNAGWQYNALDDSWTQGKPRTMTFAEKAEGKQVRLYHMRDVEIMRPGTWKGQTYTVEDLRSIARDTNAALSQLRPPMVPEHPLVGPAKRAAALGWPKGLYVDERGSLRARAIKGIPESAAQVLEDGGYSDFSVGLRRYIDQETGREYPRVLDHLALTNFPVIKTMEGVGALYEEPAVLAASEDGVEVITFCALEKPAEREGTSMADQKADAGNLSEVVEKAVAGVAAKYETQFQALKATLDASLSEAGGRVSKLEEENKALRERETNREKAGRRAAAVAFVEDKVRTGVISAAQRPYEEALACALSEIGNEQTIQLSEGDKTIEATPFDLYKLAINKRPAVIRIGMESARRVAGDGDGVVSALLSETALVSQGHAPEDAKRVVEAEKAGSLVADLDPRLDAIMHGRK